MSVDFSYEVDKLREVLKEALEIIASLTEGGEELDEMLRQKMAKEMGVPAESLNVTHPKERYAREFLARHGGCQADASVTGEPASASPLQSDSSADAAGAEGGLTPPLSQACWDAAQQIIDTLHNEPEEISINYVAAVIYDMARRRDAGAWRPIETVPLYETVLLAYRTDGKQHTGNRYGIGSYSEGPGGNRIAWDRGGWDWAMNPTHWMPLPALPKARSE